MRRYDDPVEVRKGLIPGFDSAASSTIEGPEQFLWRGRLWQVREVVAHWVETGAWWARRSENTDVLQDLLREREVWRVAAARGREVSQENDPGFGVFDLVFNWSDGSWQLAGAID